GMNVPAVGLPGWEADDVIATLSKQGVEADMDVVIVATDKDARQLLGPRVQMFNYRRNEVFTVESLNEKWGVRPDQVIDFQSLVGDSVDNVPGVPLVGPKKAQALLEKWNDLETVLANADEAPGKKLRENLKVFADQARLSRELVMLRTDLELDFKLEDAEVNDPNAEVLRDLFASLGFRRFREDMQTILNRSMPQAALIQRKAKTIESDGELARLIELMSAAEQVAIQPEGSDSGQHAADVTGLAVVLDDEIAFHLPFNTTSFRRKVVEEFAKVFSGDPSPRLVSHDIKRTLWVLRHLEDDIHFAATPGVDPMLADYLLEAGERGHDLQTLSQRYLQRDLVPPKKAASRQKTMFETDSGDSAQFVRRATEAAWDIATIAREQLEKNELWDLYDQLERPLVTVLHEMETRGIKVAVDELKRQSDQAAGALDAITAEIHSIAGREFNIDSPKQLREVLFDELNLPVVKKTKTGPSTDAEVLEKLAEEHELPSKIIEQRHLTKLKGTYLDALPKLVNPKTGRIHATFQQAVAATGRLSSTDPNLQNIPVRTQEGKQVRRAFIPGEPNWKLVCADYSQIELRVLAHFCQDPAMLQAFHDGIDIHTAVAAEVYDVDAENVTSDMRRVAKAVNFGVIYGQTPWGLAKAIKVPKEDAAEFIDDYFEKYGAVDAFLEQVLTETSESGYARTILNRRRPITGIRRTTGRNRNMPERTAINTVIQGSAADLIKQAMINIHNRIEREGHSGRMLLQIHDELVFEVPESDADSLVDLVREEMVNAFDLSVPLVVDAAIANNWLDAK
ncbi:MAG: DNA polymerase I, partial [Planctomycetaceae bacterium]